MNKNQHLLTSFTEYCNAHPEQRFWQALKNWSFAERILYRVVYQSQGYPSAFDADTYEWVGKNWDERNESLL